MVFYRKYRPQTLSELDSTSVRTTLEKVLMKSVPHAMLFTGPKGLGKTSAARIIAKVVNCLAKRDLASPDKGERGKGKGEIIEPCNECEQCVSITSGTNLDVLEIDAASNRGIDEIRELKEKIRLAPASARKKVYIIDEVHMLTTEAFNALLKTLEEPPSHALFILCTTEEQKVPATILSRCFHINFTSATKEELARSLQRIITGEKINISKDGIAAIADLSEGGFRDAAKLLEEIVAFAGQAEITKKIIEKHFKVTGVFLHIDALLTHLANYDRKESLLEVRRLHDEGVKMLYFTEQLITTLHALLLEKAGVGESSKLKVIDSSLDIDQIRLLLLLFTKAFQDMKYAVIPELPLELAIIEWGSNKNSEFRVKNSELPREEKKNEGKSYTKTDPEVSVSTLRKHVGNIQKIKALYGDNNLTDTADESPIVRTTSVELLNFSAEGELTPEWMDTFWKCIISQMKSHNHTLAGVLRGCTIKSFDRKNLIIEAAYKFHKDKLADGKTRDVLESVCKELTGKPVSVEIVLKSN